MMTFAIMSVICKQVLVMIILLFDVERFGYSVADVQDCLMGSELYARYLCRRPCKGKVSSKTSFHSQRKVQSDFNREYVRLSVLLSVCLHETRRTPFYEGGVPDNLKSLEADVSHAHIWGLSQPYGAVNISLPEL